MRTGIAYTSARILLLGISVILLYWAGARGLLLLVLAFAVSAIASYILLNKQREAIAAKLNGRLGKVGGKFTGKAAELRGRLEEGTAMEDDDAESPIR
jgi:hypothetical protein